MSPSIPFARLEARMNTAVMNRLSNAVATLSGVEVCGIFDEPYARADIGYMDAATSRPTFTMPTDQLPAGPDWRSFLTGESGAVDLRISVRGVDYLVVGHEPDGTGLSRLVLQRIEA